MAPPKPGHRLREQPAVAEYRLQPGVVAGIARRRGRRIARVQRSQFAAFAKAFFTCATGLFAGFTSASWITVWILTMRSANVS